MIAQKSIYSRVLLFDQKYGISINFCQMVLIIYFSMVNIECSVQELGKGYTAGTSETFSRMLLIIIISFLTIHELDKVIAWYNSISILIYSRIRSPQETQRSILNGKLGTIYQQFQALKSGHFLQQIVRLIRNDKRLLEKYEIIKQLYGKIGKGSQSIEQLNGIICQHYENQQHLFFFQNLYQAHDNTRESVRLSYLYNIPVQMRIKHQDYTVKTLQRLLNIIIPLAYLYIYPKDEKVNPKYKNRLRKQVSMLSKINLKQVQKKTFKHLNNGKMVSSVKSHNSQLCDPNEKLIIDNHFIKNDRKSYAELTQYCDLNAQIDYVDHLEWTSIFKIISKFIQETFTKIVSFIQIPIIQRVVLAVSEYFQYPQFPYQKLIFLIQPFLQVIAQGFQPNSQTSHNIFHNKYMETIDDLNSQTQSTHYSQILNVLQQFLIKGNCSTKIMMKKYTDSDFLYNFKHLNYDSILFQVKELDNIHQMFSIKNDLKRLNQRQSPLLEIVPQLNSQPSSFLNQTLEPIRKFQPFYNNGHSKAILFNREDNTSLISKDDDDDNASICSSIYLDFDADLNQEYSFIGVLITIKKGDQQVSASTAFLINDRTLVTCIHAFQNDMRDFSTTSIIFVPNCVNSIKTFRYTAHISKEDVYTTNKDPNYSYKAVGRQLALVSLSEPIRLGIRIPKYASYEEMDSRRVFIVGYPLSQIKYSFVRENTVEDERAVINRQHYEGDYVSIDPAYNIIEHNLPTQAGVSGAPIMARNKDNPKEIMIVGIHTHGAKLRQFNNMGLLFTKEIVEMIDKFVRENEENISESEDDDYQECEEYEASNCCQSEVATDCHDQAPI